MPSPWIYSDEIVINYLMEKINQCLTGSLMNYGVLINYNTGKCVTFKQPLNAY